MCSLKGELLAGRFAVTSDGSIAVAVIGTFFLFSVAFWTSCTWDSLGVTPEILVENVVVVSLLVTKMAL